MCYCFFFFFFFFFSSRRRHTRLVSDWSSDVCSSDLSRLHSSKPSLENAFTISSGAAAHPCSCSIHVIRPRSRSSLRPVICRIVFSRSRGLLASSDRDRRPPSVRLAQAVAATGSHSQAMVGTGLAVPTKDLSASDWLPSGDLVPGRVGNLRGLDLRSSFNHLRHGLQHFCIGSAVIGFRVLLLLPQTDSDRFPAFRGDEGDLVLEALRLPKDGNDFPLNQLGELRDAIGLQLHANGTSKHVDPLGGLRGALFR